MKEKKNNAAILMPKEYDTAIKEIPRMKAITIATVSEKFRITGSLANRLIMKLAKEGVLSKVVRSKMFVLYRKSKKQIALEEELKKKAEEEAEAKAAAKKAAADAKQAKQKAKKEAKAKAKAAKEAAAGK